jgi:hypothetical protein
MEAPEHEWVDYGRWRQCLHCGQRQFMAARLQRGAWRWLPEPEPCVRQDSNDNDPDGEPS